MQDPGCGLAAWGVLKGRLWHATSLDGFRGIWRDGFVKPGNGHKGSFAGARRWVSLFDFGLSARDEWGQWKNWAPWFGATHDAGLSVWLEIDREAGGDSVVEAESLRLLWREEINRRVEKSLGEPWAGLVIPGVEGAFRGDLQTALVMRAVVFRSDCSVVADLAAEEDIDERILAISCDA